MKKLEVDMTKGSIFIKIVRFSIPLMIMSILQTSFNMADIFVLGIFVGDSPVAAVGATTEFVNISVNFFIGLAVGANVVVARYLGSNDPESIKRNIGLSIFLAITSGLLLLILGQIFAKDFLIMTNCDPQVLDMATTYLKIYFIGMPFVMIDNFNTSILRAAGNTTKPLIFSLIAGVINIGLNIFFVITFHMDVEGVAIATIISQAISMSLSTIVLIKNKGDVKLEIKRIKFVWNDFKNIIKIGFPSGIQLCLFNISNILIQSSVNKFGVGAMGGYSYEKQIASIVYVAMNGIALTCMSFVGQNYGAKNIERIKKIILYSFLYVTGVGISVGILATFVGPVILRFITNDEEVLYYCQEILYYVTLPYFLLGITNVLSYAMRAFGKSLTSMIVCVFGICVLRIVWIETIFKIYNTVTSIFISYPLSWLVTDIILLIMIIVLIKKTGIQFKNSLLKESI